jgi:hypothetical protein
VGIVGARHVLVVVEHEQRGLRGIVFGWIVVWDSYTTCWLVFKKTKGFLLAVEAELGVIRVGRVVVRPVVRRGVGEGRRAQICILKGGVVGVELDMKLVGGRRVQVDVGYIVLVLMVWMH